VFNYLYYKLYQATLKGSLKDIPQFMAPVYFGALISTNISIIYLFLVKIDVLPYWLKSPKQGGYFAALVIVLSLIYFNKSKREAILQKYSDEERKERIRGNIIVSIYVAISFLSIFAVAFFKPGKL
jgi:hypothetical protein